MNLDISIISSSHFWFPSWKSESLKALGISLVFSPFFLALYSIDMGILYKMCFAILSFIFGMLGIATLSFLKRNLMRSNRARIQESM